MIGLRTSTIAATLIVMTWGTSADAQIDTRRDSMTANAANPQDWSWYPHESKPPFVSELVEGEDLEDVIHAGNAVFTIDDEPAIPRELTGVHRADGAFAAGYFIVHFARPIEAADKEWLDDLTAPVRRADGSPLARWYIPNNALIAWIDDTDTLDRIANADPIDYVGRYHPAYKLDPTIGSSTLTSGGRIGRLTYRLDVDLIPGHAFEPVIAALDELGVNVVERVDVRGERTYDVRFLIVDARPELVARIAMIEGVRTILESGDGVKIYDLSGGGKLQNRNLAADDQSASPIVTAANFPLWVTHDLQGQGQLVGVLDTSLDWNNVGTSGCNFGFPDTSIQNYGFANPNLAKVLLATIGSGGVSLKVPRADILGGATLLGIAGNEHGCAVAGAALADFYGNNDTKWWEHDVDSWESWAPSNFSGLLGPGVAHEAQLFFTPVMDSSNIFRWESPGEFPTNLGITLSNMANAGAATSVHSLGLAESNNTYTQVSVVHDTEAFDHPTMLQCMAAGNSGAGTNRLSSQAVVKNAITVGASDDVLRPEDRATFSSTGPVFDGRLKPDVMATGDDTAPRTGSTASLLILNDTNGGSTASCAYQWTSGTSFSAPIIGGAGALVHQYFEEGRYGGSQLILDPSAALIKAALVNAGHRLTGANLGNGNYPNDYQGWGEPNLSDVLDFGTGSRRLIAYDVPSGAGFTGAGNANDDYVFTVGSSTQRLRVTLVWTDEPGSAGTGKKLINDLDLRVTAPGGTLYRGNVITGSTGLSATGGTADTLNNVENVILNAPATGTWSATVDPGAGNYSIGQGYALVVTGDVVEGGGGGPSAPVAEFTGSPTSGTTPLNVNFTSLATGTISTWAWTFGDGGTSNAVNPSHTYTTAGSYNVSLTVTGPGGMDTETKNGYVTVNDPPTGGALYYMSFDTTTTVPGLGSVADEDVVTYDPATGTWAMYFDGSDVGLGGTDVNALHVLSDGALVLSFDSTTFSVPGLVGGPSGNTVEDRDLVLFSFTSSGATTSGSFQFVFDGSDVGLATSSEDIDGVYEFPGGGLAISTIGNPSVPGVSAADEDVLLFSATQYGSATIGTWSLYFDGSDVGFSNSSSEDVNALTFDNGIDLIFSTTGSYSAAGGSGSDEDVSRFSGTFGSATSGTAARVLDLSALGISTAEDVDGLHYSP